jgi:hypothetical protein
MDTEALISKIDFDHIEKHPNILIAARFWDDKRYHAAKVCYKFMRMIDDFIDDRKATGKEISCMEKEELSEKVQHWIECLDGSANGDPFYEELTRTISTFKIPLVLFRILPGPCFMTSIMMDSPAWKVSWNMRRVPPWHQPPFLCTFAASLRKTGNTENRIMM